MDSSSLDHTVPVLIEPHPDEPVTPQNLPTALNFALFSFDKSGVFPLTAR